VSRRRDLVPFLLDENSIGFAACIRRHRVLTFADVGLEYGAPDHKVVEHARDHGAIVLTRDRDDFRSAMLDAANTSSAGDCQAMDCHEGGGLVTIGKAVQSFHFGRVTRALTLSGLPITWDDVFFLNLRVHIAPRDRVMVELLPQCHRCLARHTPDCERCQLLQVLARYEEQFGIAI